MSQPPNPPKLLTHVILSDPQPVYPEQSNARFSPATHPVGVCFSGGGPRSLVASTGQMCGLLAAPNGLYDRIGAISVVSGGSWFGTLFAFGDPTIPDSEFLGTPEAPATLTKKAIRNIPHSCLPYGVTTMTNLAITGAILYAWHSGTPLNRLYASILNSLLVRPFKVDANDRFFTADLADVNAIIAVNPALTPENFYLMRDNRPYIVAGATQIYPVDHNLVMRHFEYSPLYSGTEQFFDDGSPKGPFGGGFVQNFAFDSSTPGTPSAEGLISVNAPLRRFTLADMMGSSGAAPGSVLDALGFPSLFAEFHYWPPASAGTLPDPTTNKMSIVDGGDLENTGIVAMLRRQYPVIIVCVNTSTPLNPNFDPTNPADKEAGTYMGVDYQIAALFGFEPPETTATREIRKPMREKMGLDKMPKMNVMTVAPEDEMPKTFAFSVPQQPIQVFPQDDFAAVQKGLMDALATGGVVWTSSRHDIWPDNPFGIPPYPDDKKVTVIWLYNQKIAQWVSQLPAETQEFLTSTDRRNYMANFPNYHTVLQNDDILGIPELLLLTPEQVNLLMQMWSWAILQIADDLKAVIDEAVG